MRVATVLALLLAAPGLAQTAGGAAPPEAAPSNATLSFIGANGLSVGGGLIADTADDVTLTAQFTDLPPGALRLRLHETGLCDAPDFASAGAALRLPTPAADGGSVDAALPEIAVGDAGVAIVRAVLEGVTLLGEDGLLDSDSAAVVAHGDDGRIACAVLEPG